MLSVRKLCKSYVGANGSERRSVLRDLDLDVAAGEYIAITGESGVGKSTLLNLIAGLDTPDSGAVSLAGTEISSLDDHRRTLLRRHDIGFVFQAFHLLPRLSIVQNVALPLSLLGYKHQEAAERALEILHRLGLDEYASELPRVLSSGQLQRVAIGRALVHRPRLLLADEPTGNLDPETAARVLALLKSEIGTSATAAILVTHSRAAAATTHRVLELTASGLRAVAH